MLDRSAVPLLHVDSVSVHFGGLQALSDVTLEVPEGEVTGLIGPNGAGKTTLFNVVTGLQVPSAGGIALDGTDITDMKPHQRARLGIGRTFQRLETFGTLSARENVLVAAEMRRAWSRESFTPSTLADELIERLGLTSVARERGDRLPTGTQRLVEMARALATKPRVVLLDEPSSGLDETETADLSELLVELAATGLAILLVEHDMGLVMSACHHIQVLDFGRIIASGTPTEVQADPVVRAAYLGEGDEADEVPGEQQVLLEEVSVLQADVRARVRTASGTASTAQSDGATIELRDVRAAYGGIDVLHGVSLCVPRGAVYALLGPNGAGKSTTLKVASGRLAPTAGEVRYLGEPIGRRPSDQLARQGLCTIPEGRGIFPNLTVLENLRAMTYAGTPLSRIEEQTYTRFPRLKERRKQTAGTLSGGEQQMLAIARAIGTEPKVLLLDELSMGLAPLVVSELYDVVKRIAAEDVSILVVEQFAHEVLDVADAAAIILHGRVQFEGSPATVARALENAYLGGNLPGPEAHLRSEG